MWPNPPIPTMPTRLVGLAYIASGLNTVMPPHRSGPASAASMSSGRGMAQAQWERTRLANAALVPDDRGRGFRAQMMIARHALPAVHAAAGRPADPDALPDLQRPCRRSDLDHPADGFVSQHGRELREAPLVVEHRDVGVAQAAVLDLNLHLLGPERSEFDLLPDQFALGALWRPMRRSLPSEYSRGEGTVMWVRGHFGNSCELGLGHMATPRTDPSSTTDLHADVERSGFERFTHGLSARKKGTGTRPTGSLPEIPGAVRGREPVPFFRPRPQTEREAI